MERPCRICSHQRRDEIDAALLNHTNYKAIAAHFQTSMIAILGHRSHLDGFDAPPTGPAPAQPLPGAQPANAAAMLDQMRSLCDACVAPLQTAESSTELWTVSLSLGQVRRNLKALGDLAARLRQTVPAATADDLARLAEKIALAAKQ